MNPISIFSGSRRRWKLWFLLRSSHRTEEREDNGHVPVGGQDSLTDLQQGTNRYLTLVNPFNPSTRELIYW